MRKFVACVGASGILANSPTSGRTRGGQISWKHQQSCRPHPGHSADHDISRSHGLAGKLLTNYYNSYKESNMPHMITW